MLLVAFGAQEESVNRDKCLELSLKCTKSFVPKVPTKFGIYMATVCGTSNTTQNIVITVYFFNQY